MEKYLFNMDNYQNYRDLGYYDGDKVSEEEGNENE